MEYPEDLNVDSDWFPFDSKADALIYLWDAPGKSNRLPQDRLTSLLQMLPLIGVDGITLQSGQKFRDKYAARIPLMKIHTTTAVKSIRHHRKAKKKTDSNNQPNTSEKIVSPYRLSHHQEQAISQTHHQIYLRRWHHQSIRHHQ